MVTSNKPSEKKFVKMAVHNNSAVVPQRTLLGEVNEHITCPLCRGYYIDATTIVECLHSFCRSCIIKHLQVKSYCPVCEMMINSAKPNIKLDKALQDIVYKLVPGLFQKEMERRQQFYSSRPGPAASATPEQRGEDTERIIFSPEDVISFSLEYTDATDSDSISSKSSDSNESQQTAASRRYLQCPAVVNISHLKKFLSMKFDIDSTQFAIDVLYKRVPLPDCYTLMDIAYIYNWKRNEPMRFFYQIIDYASIRTRFLDINRKGAHFRDRKSSPASTEDTNISSPATNINDHTSEISSGADSPMPDENSLKQTGETMRRQEKGDKNNLQNSEDKTNSNKPIGVSLPKKNDDDVEKSQFLISFELTAKSNNTPTKSSPVKTSNIEIETTGPEISNKNLILTPKQDDTLKRKNQSPPNTPELKKIKIELEKTKMPNLLNKNSAPTTSHQNIKTTENSVRTKDADNISKNLKISSLSSNISSVHSSPVISKETKSQQPVPVKQVPESSGIKRSVANPQNNISSPKRKPNDAPSSQNTLGLPKTVSPLKLQIPKLDSHSTKPTDIQKNPLKKIPDLKPSVLVPHTPQNKSPVVNKVRMDLLANNSDPTIDRSKILSQVKTSLSSNNIQGSGDPLKSIFDSCNINIPSSLSITLTDQKLDARNFSEVTTNEQKKNIVNKNLAVASSVPVHKVPSPPVHNYIEILKLPDTELKKTNKTDSDNKLVVSNKLDSSTPQPKVANKSSEGSAKGPVPNLKPISDTKLGKQTGNFATPITFQQTFEKQLQSMQTDKKPKMPKAKTQVPKLVPAPKVFNVVSKSTSLNNKPQSNVSEPKPSSALDLSTPHSLQSQVGAQQTFDKALETMQSIANLAKKQNLPSKGLPLPMSQNSNSFTNMGNRPLNSGVGPVRVPPANTMSQIKLDKNSSQHSNAPRQDVAKSNPLKSASSSGSNILSPNYPVATYTSPSTTQPSPRSQTRSPSSSPKLVIAEEKQAGSSLDQNVTQTNQIINTQLPTLNTLKESPKASPGSSKSGLKPVKPPTQTPKMPGITGIRPPMALNPAEYLSRPQLMSSHQHFLRQMEVNTWLKVQRQFEFIKSMAHQTQNDFNNKDKQQ